MLCYSTVSAPLISLCCNRIIGCRACVTTLRNTDTRCPLCSRTTEVFEAKGIDDFTALFRAGESSGNIEASGSADVDTVSTGSSDEFEASRSATMNVNYLHKYNCSNSTMALYPNTELSFHFCVSLVLVTRCEYRFFLHANIPGMVPTMVDDNMRLFRAGS